jgi:GlpG protein
MEFLVRAARSSPVTAALTAAALVVFLATDGRAAWGAGELWQLERAWGAVVPLGWTAVDDQQLSGPLDLWSGEWWRIPLSSLHHIGVVHLLVNLAVGWVLLPKLEVRWGPWRTGLFVVSAAFVTSVPEYLFEGYLQGVSGVLCAVFGALLVLRQSDPDLAEELPDEVVGGSLLLLAAMLITSWLEIMPVANLAHFSGLCYGWVTAWCCAQPQVATRGRRLFFLLGHALVVAAYLAVLHPVWIGRYHWNRAMSDDGTLRQDAQAAADVQRALELDPSLSALWRATSSTNGQEANRLGAWQRLVKALAANPTDRHCWADARRLWRRLAVSADREAAVRIVQQELGDAAESWLQEVRRIVTPPVLIAPGRPPEPPPHLRALVAPPTAPPAYEPPPAGWPWSPSGPREPRPFDPAHPDSAAEGRLM